MGIAAGIHPALYGKVTLPQRPEQPIQAEAPAAKAEPSQHQNSKETKAAAPRGKKRGQNSGAKKPSIRIYFLGGLNEIGKNFTLYECEGDMLIVDCGMSFPDDAKFGGEWPLRCLPAQLTPPSGGFLCGKNSAGGWLRPTDGVRIREPHGQ